MWFGRRWIVSSALAVALSLCATTCEMVDAPRTGLEFRDLRLVAAHSARLLVCGLLICGWTSAGGVFLSAIPAGRRTRRGSPGDYLIAAGFLGAAIVAGAMVLAGFAGMLNRWLALGLMLPLVAAAPFSVGDTAGRALRMELRPLRRSPRSARLAAGLLLALIGGAAICLFSQRAVFPESSDSDVWDHYLHYYREVLASGSLAPGEVWLHFFHSKGAGLFFLGMLLTDELGAPIASCALVLLMAAVVFDLLRRATGNRLWGLTGVLLLLLYLAAPNVVPSFHKHHLLLAANALFILWAGIRATAAPSKTGSFTYAASAAAAAGHTTFLVPQSAMIFLPALAVFALAGFLLRRRWRIALPPAMISAGGAAGTALALMVNFAATGLPEMAPAGLFWKLADRERFEQRWSPLVMEYYFVEQEGAGRGGFRNTEAESTAAWLARLFRWRYFDDYLTAAAIVAAATACSFVIRRLRAKCGDGTPLRQKPRATRGATHIAVACGAFFAGALGAAFAMIGAESIIRMYAFVGVFLILGLVMACHAMLRQGPRRSWLGLAGVGVCIFLPLKGFVKNFPREELAFAGGGFSTREALDSAQARWGPATTLDDFLAAKRAIPFDQRMIHLCYEPGPGYVIGPSVVVCEPSHSFGGDYERLLFGSPAEARHLLERQGINYFGVNVRAPLFLGIPYSELFSDQSLRQNFTIALQHDDFYLLTWRKEGDAPLPDDFRAALANMRVADTPLRRLRAEWLNRRQSKSPHAKP